MRSLLLRVVALSAVAVLILAPPAAYADGDPSSDTLLREDVYFPYEPVSDPYGPALVKLLKKAREIGFPIKVSLIQAPADLGAYAQLFGDPQAYTSLLAASLPQPRKPQHGVEAEEPLRLLVVMPTGFGGQNLGEGVDKALAPIDVDEEAGADGLARAALQAVPRLATEAGYPLDVPPEATAPPEGGDAEEGGSGTSALVFIAPLLLVLIGAGLAGRAAKRRSEQESAAGAETEPAPESATAGAETADTADTSVETALPAESTEDPDDEAAEEAAGRP